MDNLKTLFNQTIKEETNLSLIKEKNNIFNELKNGIENNNSEAWRFTPIESFIRKNFHSELKVNCYQKISNLPKLNDLVLKNFYSLVFINGMYNKELTSNHLAKNIELKNYSEDLIKQPIKTADTYFAKFTKTITKEYLEINLAKTEELSINIIHLYVKDKCLANTKLNINVNENATLNIVEQFIDDHQNNHSFSTVNFNIYSNANVYHYVLQQNSKNALSLANYNVKQLKSSNFKSFCFDFGSSMMRRDFNVQLLNENIYSEINGIYYPQQDQLVDNHIIIEHLAPNCDSNQFFKGVVANNAKVVFNGKIVVDKLAQKTNAMQKNENIKFDNAKINANPELEIFADDVKCSHGATIGNLDQQTLLYMLTRGINKIDSTKIILESFLLEVTKKIKNEQIKNRVNNLLKEKINN